MANAVQLKQKAQGFINAIDKMAVAAKQRCPSGQFGEDYNKLVRLVKEAAPSVADVLPPEAEVKKDDFTGEPLTVQKFDELCAYCHQIVNLLP